MFKIRTRGSEPIRQPPGAPALRGARNVEGGWNVVARICSFAALEHETLAARHLIDTVAVVENLRWHPFLSHKASGGDAFGL